MTYTDLHRDRYDPLGSLRHLKLSLRVLLKEHVNDALPLDVLYPTN